MDKREMKEERSRSQPTLQPHGLRYRPAEEPHLVSDILRTAVWWPCATTCIVVYIFTFRGNAPRPPGRIACAESLQSCNDGMPLTEAQAAQHPMRGQPYARDSIDNPKRRQVAAASLTRDVSCLEAAAQCSCVPAFGCDHHDLFPCSSRLQRSTLPSDVARYGIDERST